MKISLDIERLHALFRTRESTHLSVEEYEALLAEAWLGNPAAQYAVGNALEKGELASQDPAAACFWFRKAAEQRWRPALKKIPQ